MKNAGSASESGVCGDSVPVLTGEECRRRKVSERSVKDQGFATSVCTIVQIASICTPDFSA